MVDWNARYAARPGPLYGEQPNEYLREIAARSDFAATSALMLADGDGRNGRWLAGRGITVTAVDIASVATERAETGDRLAAVHVERITADLAQWTPVAGTTFAAAVMTYLHCDPPSRTKAIATAAAVLAPGGWFIAEGFAKPQAAIAGMGPSDPDLLYSVDVLLAALPTFEVVEALEGRVRLREGSGHDGLAHVVRIAVRKPT